jgi:hypothetical protein
MLTEVAILPKWRPPKAPQTAFEEVSIDRSRDTPYRYLAVKPDWPQLSAGVQIAAMGIEPHQLRAGSRRPHSDPDSHVCCFAGGSPRLSRP